MSEPELAGILVSLGASNISVADGSISPGLNLLAGLRVFVRETIALFGEVKQNQSKLSFVDNQFTARYRARLPCSACRFISGGRDKRK